jgi:hypothetical protein
MRYGGEGAAAAIEGDEEGVGGMMVEGAEGAK